MSDKYYLHTIDGKPGHFDGFQICRGAKPVRLAKDLDQIRREQRATKRNRKKAGFHDLDSTYSHVRVYLPEES